MFQNLGRLLTECYLPDEAVQIRQALGKDQTSAAAHPAREVAACKVLGLSLNELGAGVAKAWGLPDSLQHAMHAPEGQVPAKTIERGPERLRWLARAASRRAPSRSQCSMPAGASRTSVPFLRSRTNCAV